MIDFKVTFVGLFPLYLCPTVADIEHVDELWE